MYDNNSFKKDYNAISNRIEKILCDFPKYEPVFNKLKAASVFSEERKLDTVRKHVLFAYILEPHLDELNSFFDYYKKTINIINKFFDNYDDYRDKGVDGWIGTIVLLNDIIIFYNNIISNL